MLTHGHTIPASPTRVVILGERGFVAPKLASSIRADGVETLALGRTSIDLVDPSSQRALADIFLPGDAVVLAAALTPERGRDPGTLIKNLRMGEHIAAAISVRKISQLIYLSSDAIFGQVLDKIDEGTSASPVDLYGVMHWSRELMFRELANKSNIPFCVLRPSAIFGPGDTHNSYGPNRFVRSSLREGTIRLFGLGEELRDHVFIDDVVRVAKLAIYHGSSGTLNVVSGQTISFGDLATMIAELGGGTTRIESTPRLGAITHRSFDASAISRSFVRFQPTPLKVGLSKTIDSFSRE